ncbi:signal transduction histidine kinase [Roseivivax halodurans JCM 10272]|uniref:Signal transduction histidine kinase n=1 Tax=Roseivivax halodurans JCM 10272 TaxID=1449350 RepID=X7EN77_9RHOB|nr:DUF6446 family protein [Roseivivax halodurans]ETX16651.1 signal transduction histidine kinase [Roseivivax halodurans JCM 10272]
MTGKILAALILVVAIVAGGAMYYLQVYAFYDEVPEDEAQISLTPMGSDAPEPLPFEGFEGIDAGSSPIRYRACFRTDLTLEEAAQSYKLYPDAVPRVAPGWFSCFDAEEIGQMIEDGRADVFLSERNIEFGIDRVVAITEDGFGYVWHEINECGDKSYDGTPLGEDCPAQPAG